MIKQSSSPVMSLLQEPRLTSAKKWSDWFSFCTEVLKEPDFFVARDPLRRAMISAVSHSDHITRQQLLDRFRESNQEFLTAVRNRMFKDSEIFSRLNGGTIAYLCAGIDLSLDLALAAGPSGKLLLIDHAPSVISHLNREVITKNRHSSCPQEVFRALEMSVHQIGAKRFRGLGLNPGHFDAIVAIRGLHRVRPSHRVKTLQSAQNLLRPGGIVVITELFEDDRPEDRPATPGAWHWFVSCYRANLSQMTLVIDSGPVIRNQDDMCRMLVFVKKTC